MTTKQEVQRLLKERAPSIIDERILPEILDNILDWSGQLMGKLTTLSADDTKKIDEVANVIYCALIWETIKQLEKCPKKKLSK